MNPEDEAYFERLESGLDDAFEVAEAARERGDDPTDSVEIPVARDMADRVENILGIDGVAERVRELEGEMSREQAALELVSDFVDGDVGDYESRAGKVEGAVRTAVALLTEGVVAAPIEGIDRVEILENDDGTEFVNVYYAGPIRSAGGTAQALSVLVADYARAMLGIDQYRARDNEIGRYAEEIALYDRETGLQYSPKEKESKFIAEHMPTMLDGEATGDEEVSGYRDLERVDSNSARGGMCLVMAEGIALKAPKIQRYTRNLDEVDWPWLQDLIDGTIGTDEDDEDGADDEEGDEDTAGGDEADEESDDHAGPPRLDPSKKFLRDLIAGRPVFSHPSEAGGFRLRYGRARNHGNATAGVHPATMHLVDDFLAAGTQIKTERPGKAAGVVPVDTIEGPTVRLANGEVRRIDGPEEALEVRNGVEKVVDLGEYLVNYGEFVENNHPLAPASYTVEWWVQEFDEAGADLQAMRDSTDVDLSNPSAQEALDWVEAYDAPLHPNYTYCWHDLSVDEVCTLADAVEQGRVAQADGAVAQDPDDTEDTGGTQHDAATDGHQRDAGAAAAGDLVLPRSPPVREAVEHLLVEHTQTEDTLVVPDWRPLVRSLGFDDSLERDWSPEDLSERARTYGGGEASDAQLDSSAASTEDGANAILAVNEVAPFAVRERAPTRIGNRMGRPEKSESRDLSPAVHTLFPIGETGGSQRKVGDAAVAGDSYDDSRGKVELEVGRQECTDCGNRTYKPRCPDCGGVCEAVYVCPDCDSEVEPDESGRAECSRCETLARPTRTEVVDVNREFKDALANLNERPTAYDALKAVKGLSSEQKTPEPMEKGILRAKHGVSAFKDGTVRYDMTDLPVTAVRPSELDVTAEAFRALGYEDDIHGQPLQHDDQLVELNVQDVVLSEGAAEHMLRTADFVDDLLESYYGLDPFYELDERDDLVGELVFGMAPHTSAATVGRIIGFTTAAVGYAHPYFHAAKRRNCFHPDTKVWYVDEAGEWHHETIERLVENRLENPEEDDFGSLVQELSGELTVPSVTESGEPVRKPVEALSKHPSTDHLIEVKTKTGRTLTVSPEHSMRRWDGKVERVSARNLEVGDDLPMPKSVQVDGHRKRIDLLEEFCGSDAVPNDELVVRGLGSERIKSLFDEATSGDYYLKPTTEQLGLSDSTVYNWVSRDSVPVAVFDELFERSPAEILPDDITLSLRRDTATVERYLTIDNEFATVLGYYAAEGFTRQSEGNFYQTTICIPDQAAREQIIETFRGSLGIEGFEENQWKITVSSRLVTVLFDEILYTGCRAETKCIPESVLSGPTDVLRAFLAAYFSGDGSVSSSRIEVRAHTVSDELKSDLIAALKRFGIITKAYRETRTPETGAIAEFYDEQKTFESWVLKVTSENAVRFADEIGFHLPRKSETLQESVSSIEVRTQRLCGDGGDIWLDEIETIDIVESETSHLYSLTVKDTNTLVAEDLFVGQCDGDEDCVMLLMDGLLNFSRQFLPNRRGGRMDAPLVMSSRIDPSEIDDEAHNVDIMREYPKEFYEATRELADPEDVEDIMTIAETTLGTDEKYSGFDHTHDTSDIAAGPDLSAYKTLGSMEEKMDAQLELSRKIRAVDETDVAERIIEYHFLPDLIGNLRAFSRQDVRCLDCGEKYRRMPLSGDCRECGGRVNLTVHEGSVNKYIETATRVAEEFGCRTYTKQRLEVLDRSIKRVFENDNNKQSGIADFM
ncbi:type III effector protein [Halobacteriales archaeon QS_9_67_15]|nr:MAG: type III effector protein [Halobacteriales archaeon QS_9_67_15]